MKSPATSQDHSYGTGTAPANNVEEAIALAQDVRALEREYKGDLTLWQQLKASPYVLLCSVAAAAAGFAFGFDQGLISVVLTTRPFLERFPQVDTAANSSASFWKGLMTAMLELGAFLGSLHAGWSADKYSRRKTLFFGIVWFMIGTILQATAFSYAHLVVGRLIGGVGVGILGGVAPSYVAETAPPNLRGLILVTEGGMCIVGVITAYWISYATKDIPNDWCFRAPFIVQAAPALFLGLIFAMLPYSPRWLCKAGREEESLATIAKLRRLGQDHPLVLAEFVVIKAESEVQKISVAQAHPTLVNQKSAKKELQLEVATWVDCFRRGVIKRSHIVIVLGFFQQFLGVNGMIYFGPSLFAALGLNSDLQVTLAGVMNTCQIVGAIFAVFLLQIVGRRPLLIGGACLIFCCHTIVAALIGAFADDWPAHPEAAWTGVAFIMLFMTTFGGSWTPVPWTLFPEVFNSTHRAKGVALGACSVWLFNFIIGLVVPTLVDQQKGAGLFIFLAVFSLLGIIWTAIFVPETNGKSLETINAMFHDASGKEAALLESECMERVCNELRMKNGMTQMPSVMSYVDTTGIAADEKHAKKDEVVAETNGA